MFKVTWLALLLGLTGVARADDAESIIATEKALWQAWAEGDAKAFAAHLSDAFVQPASDGRLMDKAAVLGGFGDCEVRSYALGDLQVRLVGDSTALLTYTATQDASCNGDAVEPHVVASSVYVKEKGRWKAASYRESALVPAAHAAVQEIIDDYVRLETDLAEQAKLMADDRVMIVDMMRQTDNATNMAAQIATEAVMKALEPDGRLFVTAEDVIVRHHGDTAVASFFRHWQYAPDAAAIKAGMQPPPPPETQLVTLVIAKQTDGDYRIVHTHVSNAN